MCYRPAVIDEWREINQPAENIEIGRASVELFPLVGNFTVDESDPMLFDQTMSHTMGDHSVPGAHNAQINLDIQSSVTQNLNMQKFSHDRAESMVSFN